MMTYFSHIRAGLISTALLLTTALASPALAESLPEISPRQIASDVEVQYHPETGAKEYLAPSFDPFEEDRNLAGTAALRSVSQTTTIDGQSVRGGALLDMTFYYNSASNDPYDTRGYEDAVYLSGDYAPVTYRDNRILECNEHVQDVVYYHEDYYRPSLYVNLYRPYRHYSGHYSFNRGYNYNRGSGFSGSFIGSRGFGSRSRSRNTRRNSRDRSRGGFTERAADRLLGTNREDRADNRRRGDRDTTRRRTGEERRNTRNNRRNGEDSRTPQTRNGQTANQVRPQTPRTAIPRPAPRSDAAAAAHAQRAEGRSRAAEKSQNAPKRNSGGKGRSQTRNRNSQSKNTQSKTRNRSSSQTRSRSRGQNRSLGRSKLKLMSFLPMASAFSRNVVRNVDVQCAREEILTVHIPQERLDAARFDGLTVLVLDREGQEVPVFVPPNYIEGFRQAVSGRVTPNVSYQEPRTSAPVTRGPIYQEPRSSIVESAPCPVGTTKQNDGSCLQNSNGTYSGYPSR